MQSNNTTDQILHQLSQVIAKVNKAFVPYQEDDSHTNLYFDSIARRITGRWFAGKDRNFLIVFDLTEWGYRILNESLFIVEQIPQKGKTVHQSEKELRNILSGLGFSVEGLVEPLHFELPKYTFLKEKLEKPDEESLITWMRIRALANQVCMEFLGHIQKTAEIRIWPHHFDTGVYVEANPEVGIGFGLAIADTMIDTPYFYLAGYPLKGKSWDWKNPNELETGKWINSENWTGAVLPVSELEFEEQNLSSFIKGALSWYLS